MGTNGKLVPAGNKGQRAPSGWVGAGGEVSARWESTPTPPPARGQHPPPSSHTATRPASACSLTLLPGLRGETGSPSFSWPGRPQSQSKDAPITAQRVGSEGCQFPCTDEETEAQTAQGQVTRAWSPARWVSWHRQPLLCGEVGALRAVFAQGSPADGGEMFRGRDTFPNCHNGPEGCGSRENVAQPRTIRESFLEEAAQTLNLILGLRSNSTLLIFLLKSLQPC